MNDPSVAAQCLALSGLFEAELLVELMLRFWSHPFADNADFRNELLEAAAEFLRNSVEGKVLFEEIPPHKVNLILAVWYAEWNSVSLGDAEFGEARNEWLEKVRHAIPSCFCNPSSLD